MRRLALLVLALSGCFFRAEDFCKGCTVVPVARPIPPRIAEGTRAVVVLLHGAFGFGPEWSPIRAALDRRRELAYYAFSWPGPFGGDVTRHAEAFRVVVQATLDTLPSTAHDVLVLAHSAGGMVADYAARRLVVPEGVRVHVLLLDSARISLSPYKMSWQPDTPFGATLSTTQGATPPVPQGVQVVDYRAADRPRHDRRSHMPPEVGVLPPDGERVYWLGRHVSHGEAVALASLPVIEQLP